MKKLLTIILVLCSVVGFAQIRGGAQYDPGAARSNLSNVDATATPSMKSITLSDKIRAVWADILGDIYASGTVKVSTGTAAAPAYTFSSDPNTGMYSPAADSIGISVAGAQVAAFTPTGLITRIEMPSNVYGVEINLATPSAPTFTRLAGAVGKTPGADFNGIGAFNRRRCNLADDGTVNAYYGDVGYAEDGSNGQVMVEQPRFYYKVVPLVTVPIANGIGSHVIRARYYISDSMIDGFKLHPAFIKDGLERPVIYLSAYEGSIYDTSASAYLLADEQVADFTPTTGDVLCSIAGAKPASGLTQNLTRANSRALAANRGSKWSLATIQSVSASQLLFLVEYASFNTQTAIGRGVCDKTDDGVTNMSNVTGATTGLGNSSGAAAGTDGLVSITYRGEENFWGNIWKWVDGFNVQCSSLHYAWIADHDFADDTTTGYANAGFTLAKANGYVSAFGHSAGFDWLFLPSAVGGSVNNPVGDYFYQNNAYSGFLVALLGGVWTYGSVTGGYYWSLSNASSTRNRDVGTRSLHVP